MPEFELKELNAVVTTTNVKGLMPIDWQQQIDEVVRNYGKLVVLQGGKVSTSLEPPSFATVYTVVKGIDIEDRLPWLMDLYQGPFREMVSKVAGREVVVDGDKKFGVNINHLSLDTQKDGYELHTDINHWTALLAASTMKEGDGGELVHLLPDKTSVATRICEGWLYIFDGRTHPHKVELLNPKGHSRTRITVPMDYIFKGSIVERTEDFNALFGNGNGNGNGHLHLTNRAE